MSTSRTCFPFLASAAARLMATVVFPQPPFWFTTDRMRMDSPFDRSSRPSLGTRPSPPLPRALVEGANPQVVEAPPFQAPRSSPVKHFPVWMQHGPWSRQRASEGRSALEGEQQSD